MKSSLRTVCRALLAALAATLLTPSAHADAFGTACPGFSGVTPTLSAPSPVVDGTDFEVAVSGAPNAFGYLVLGVSDTTHGGLDLPLDVTDYGYEACFLNVSIDVVWPFATDGDGEATIVVPGFGGFTELYLQVVLADFDPDDFDPAASFSKGATLLGVDPTDQQPGDLVFTEVMKDPAFVADGSGEWFELYNTTGEDIDIDRWTLSDGGADSVLLDAGGPLIVPAQSYAVLGNNADPGSNGGIDVLFDYSTVGSLNLSNSADALILTTPDLIEIDRIEWDDGDLWPDSTGQSMQLAEGILEFDLNDDGENWEATSCYIGGAPFNTDRGTPGTSSGECAYPTLPLGSGAIIFSEIMQNPSKVPDTTGEWFEVYNTTAADIDLDGWTFSLGGGSFVVAESFVVASGGYAVLARSADAGANGGLPDAVYDYDDALFLPNGSQTLTILDATGATSCLLQYDNGLTFPDPNGAAMTLDPASLDVVSAADGAFWCEAVTAFGAGDLGTPAAANDPCEP